MSILLISIDYSNWFLSFFSFLFHSLETFSPIISFAQANRDEGKNENRISKNILFIIRSSFGRQKKKKC